jgi:hypothetical protein
MKQIVKAREAFNNSPQGLARAAYEQGDLVFQCSVDLINQRHHDNWLLNSGGGAVSTSERATGDANFVANAVCREGWEVVNGSYVFMETGHASRDKFMSSGQRVAVSGKVVAFFLFRRCPAHRASPA